MGVVVELPPRRQKRLQENSEEPAQSAEIILFLGVRYERWPDEPPRQDPGVAPQRGGPRRINHRA